MVQIEQIRAELTWRLRQEVLYPAEPLARMEMEEDREGYHFGAFGNNKLLAVVSVFINGDDFQFRKFAVLGKAQGQGIGAALLDHITHFAINEDCCRIWCNARISAIGFYLKYQFRQTGNVFSRNGFDYEVMEKRIKN